MSKRGGCIWAIVVCTVIALCGGRVQRAQAYPASAAVTATPTTAAVPDGFVGLALEYSTIPTWVGTAGRPVNPVLVQLIRNLDPVGRPVIRIGGLSTDHAWWPAAGLSRPPGVTYDLGPSWAGSARALAQALDARLLLGLNFEADSPRLDQIEANAFLSQIGRRWIGAFNVGNEPPLYSSIPWYHVLAGRVLPWYAKTGRPVFGRGPSWDPAAFLGDFARVLAAIPAGVPIAGPDSGNPSWFAPFVARFISPHSRVRILASHEYGLNNCIKTPANPAFPSIPHMLSLHASRNLLRGFTQYVNLAHKDGASYRIDEMGSVTCNGYRGVSDTMASALWVVDSLFAVAQAGADGVNLHSYPGLSNTLFDFTDSPSGWLGTVHPLYYGALLFADAAPPGSRLLGVTTSGPPEFRAWATSGPGPVVRVLLINDSLAATAAASVSIPRGYFARATVVRLSAPSASATRGITLGGRSFGSSTRTGVLPAAIPAGVSPSAGMYRVTLPPASALLLTTRLVVT